MKTWLRKQLSLGLALCMLLALCPMTAIAQEDTVLSDDLDTPMLAAEEGSALPAANTPTELLWNVRRNSTSGKRYNETGVVSFASEPNGDRTYFIVKFYRQETEGDVCIGEIYTNLRSELSYRTVYPFEEFPEQFTTGTYYFAVTAEGDGVTYADSEVAVSDTWYYERPDTTLSVSAPVWNDDMTIDWTLDDNYGDLLEYYELHFQYVGDGDKFREDNWHYGTSYWEGSDPIAAIPVDMLEDFGSGDYYFRVRAMSSDLDRAVHSSYSPWSAAFSYTAPEDRLEVSDPAWDEDMNFTWTDAAANDGQVAYYEFHVYYRDDGTVPTDIYEWDDYYFAAPGESVSLDWMLEDYGIGTYYFCVRAVSSDPTVISSSKWSDFSEGYDYDGPSETAPAPTDLRWNVSRNSTSGEAFNEYGVCSFEGEVVGDRTRYEVEFYRQESTGAVSIGTITTSLRNGQSYRTVWPFDEFPEKFTTGTYYFTVTALGDGISYGESETVTSATWYYERADVTLSVSGPSWNDDMTLTWMLDEASEQWLEYYQLQFQYVGKGDTFDPDSWQYGTGYWLSDPIPTVPGDMLEDFGAGDYYFRVMAMSSNLKKAVHSAWSDWSEPYAYTEPTTYLSVSEPVWGENMTFTWKNDFDASAPVAYYQACVYYSEDGSVPSNLNAWDDRYDINPGESASPSWMLQEYGPGTYYFRVRAISGAPTQIGTSAWSELSAGYYYEGPTQTPPAATNLRWHVGYNGNGSTWERIGLASFQGEPMGEYTRYRVEFYRQEADGDVCIGTLNTTVRPGNLYRTLSPFEDFPEQFITGTYYFTVTARGDNEITKDGKPVKSDTWYFQRPAITLSVSDPEWNDDMTLSWTDGPDNKGLVDYYEMQFQYVGKGDTFEEDNWHYSSNYWLDNSNEIFAVPEDMLLEYGSGDYYFRLRACTEDVTEAMPSALSAWSAPFSYTKPSVSLSVSNPVWGENMTFTWTDNFDASLPLAYYQACVYFSADGSLPDDLDNWDDRYTIQPGRTLSPDWMLEEYGYGTYYFRVRAVSSDPTKASTGEWSELSAAYLYETPENTLGMPSDLRWNVDYKGDGFVTRMGSIAFKRGVPDQNRYNGEIYRVGESEPVETMSWGYGSMNEDEYFSMATFIYSDLPSGDYYFKIQARGDNVNYANSDWVDSRDYENGVWTYVKPDAQLATPTGMRWDDRNYTDWEGNDLLAALWFPVEGAAYYEVDFYYAKTEDAAPSGFGGRFDIRSDEDLSAMLDQWDLAENGDGWYYFKVRAISGDITQIRNSEWSALSKPYPLGYVIEYAEDTVNAALDLVNNNASQANVQTAVDAVAQLPQLGNVLAADTDNSQTVAQLAELEQTVAEALNVTIEDPVIADSDLAAALDVSAISVSNMALNVDTSSTEERSVQLKLDTVDETTAPPALNETLYNNTVEFSMTIEGAVDANEDVPGHQLKVPVKMVLPVPTGINPDFLVILHHKESTDAWEEIRPYVYLENGKWFATFVVESFSNFALAEATATAKTTENGSVEISVNNLPAAGGENGCYLVAVYSQSGQMLAMDVLGATVEGTVTLSIDQSKEAAYVQVMSIDSGDNWKPLGEVLPIQITQY